MGNTYQNNSVSDKDGAIASDSARRVVAVLVVLLVLIGGVALWVANRSGPEGSNQAANRFGTSEVPLNEVLADKNLTLKEAASVTINGSLQLNNSLSLAPSVQPTGAKAGQIYYDQGTNQLAYYNGSNFVFLTGQPPSGVQSLDGITGQLTLGSGLSVSEGRVTNNGVLSVQGRAGAVSFTAGAGITINGTTFVNGGVLNVVAGSPNVTVANDGSGTVTISVMAGGGGGSGVDSLNGLSGALTIANASTAGSTVTFNDATTATKGIASFNSSNFSVTGGAVNTIQNIGIGASPTFAAVNTNSIAPSSALTVGATSQSFTLRGSTASTVTATSGGNTTTVSFATPTGTRSIVLPDESGTVCLQNSTDCGFSTSSGSFINNSATLQTNANVAIQSAADASATMLLKNRATQSADILRVVDNNDVMMFRLTTFGSAQFASSAEFQSYVGIGFSGAASAGATLRVYTVQDANNGIVISGNGGQTADMLQINSQGATGIFVVGASGAVVSKNSTNSTTAFQIQRANAAPVLTVDTTGNKVVVVALDVAADLTVSGHIISGGSTPAIAAGAAACTTPTVSVSGTDTAGVITVISGTGCSTGGKMATITFNTAFGAAPRVVLTAAETNAAGLHYYADSGTIATTAFDVTTKTSDVITDATTHKWYYHVIQ